MAQDRVPLTQPVETRDGTLTKDAKACNGYFESRDNKREFVKRPGLLAVGSTLPSGVAQGLVYFNSYLYAVINNTIYKVNPTTYATTTVGTMTGTVDGSPATCYFSQTLSNGYLFIHNQVNGYLINGSTGVFTTLGSDKVQNVTITNGGTGYVSTDTITFSAPTSGTTATGTLVVSGGVITGVTITNRGTGYTTAPTYTITTSTGSSFAGTVFLTFFPTGPIVPGAVFIDTYIAVGLPNGRVYTSDVGDPTSWNALSYLTAQQQPDNLVGIARHLNYIISFGQWSTEFFYDSGNATGSPLSPASTYTIEIGCANGDSIVSFEQTIVWVGTSLTVGTGVYLIDGVTPTRISTHYIDRIINNSTLQNVKAYSIKVNGHTLYVLTLIDINKTIVYDMNEKQWYPWTSYAPGTSMYGTLGVLDEQFFKPTFFAGNGLKYFVLDYDTGALSLVNDLYYTDNGYPIYYRVVTDNIDSGTSKRKFYSRVEIIGDKIPAIMMIRHTEDDYRSWSSYKSVNLALNRPQLSPCGSSRRRAWEFLCTEPKPLRLDCAEVTFTIGEMENEGNMPTHYRK